MNRHIEIYKQKLDFMRNQVYFRRVHRLSSATPMPRKPVSRQQSVKVEVPPILSESSGSDSDPSEDNL